MHDCMAANSDQLLEQDAAVKITQSPHDYSAPDACDSVFQDVARSLQFERTDQTMDEYAGNFDFPRW